MLVNEIASFVLISIGITFTIVGVIMYYYPPKQINSLYGYRSQRSMQNQIQWDFAQEKSRRAFFIIGMLIIVLGATLYFLPMSSGFAITLGIILGITPSIFLIVLVENALKHKFG